MKTTALLTAAGIAGAYCARLSGPTKDTTMEPTRSVVANRKAMITRLENPRQA